MRKLLKLILNDLKSIDNNRVYTVHFSKDDKGKIRVMRRYHEELVKNAE